MLKLCLTSLIYIYFFLLLGFPPEKVDMVARTTGKKTVRPAGPLPPSLTNKLVCFRLVYSSLSCILILLNQIIVGLPGAFTPT